LDTIVIVPLRANADTACHAIGQMHDLSFQSMASEVSVAEGSLNIPQLLIVSGCNASPWSCCWQVSVVKPAKDSEAIKGNANLMINVCAIRQSHINHTVQQNVPNCLPERTNPRKPLSHGITTELVTKFVVDMVDELSHTMSVEPGIPSKFLLRKLSKRLPVPKVVQTDEEGFFTSE